MPFCASCGAPVEGKFCGKCGAIVVAGGSAPTPPPMGQPAGPYTAPIAIPLADNVAAALCYALGLVTGIVFLVLEPYSRNRAIRFHAFQSIFAHVAVIAAYIAFGILWHILIAILGFFGFLAGVFWPVLGLASFVLWLYLILSAYQGKTVVLPIIGPLAQKQAQA